MLVVDHALLDHRDQFLLGFAAVLRVAPTACPPPWTPAAAAAAASAPAPAALRPPEYETRPARVELPDAANAGCPSAAPLPAAPF